MKSRKRHDSRRTDSRRSDTRPKGKFDSTQLSRSRKPLRLKASVDKNRKGFAFLIFENKTMEDVFVPPREAEALFPGDRVEAVLSPRGELLELRVLEHRFREMVGRFSPHADSKRRSGWLIYERKKAHEEVFIPQFTGRVKEGDWIRVQLEFKEKGPHPVVGEILEVYGEQIPATADVKVISSEFNLLEGHSIKAKHEAVQCGNEVSAADLTGREDLRDVPFITIDGETARDFDDAIYVERFKSGYLLWVAIADVSHYVVEGSALDQEAREKGTSVYFPERAFHMLPSKLSESLCSLRPNEPRLTLVAKMTFDRFGVRQETEILEAVIESKRRATYTEIQAEADREEKNKKWIYRPHFELYQLIKKKRQERGSLDFELTEAEIRVDDQGEVLSITNRTRLDAHRLIEEFMISANEAVTEWMMARQRPFIYRVHDRPSEISLKRFQELAATVNVRFTLEDLDHPKGISNMLAGLENHPAQTLLNTALLRSMKQAVYRSTHGIHFGLASPGYTHFTSPIRRYPDLVVHRMIRMALQQKAQVQAMPKSLIIKKGQVSIRKLDRQFDTDLEQKLTEICEHCSYRERLAADAEREVIKVKQVRFMSKRLGEEFDARVSGVIQAGLFAQVLDPLVEGMVPIESMTDDLYEYDEERMVLVGVGQGTQAGKKKRVIGMGDSLRVQVVRADIEARKIEFRIIDEGQKEQAGQEEQESAP